MSLSIQTTPTVTSTTELRGVPLKTGQVLSAIVLEANQRSGQALLSLAGGQVRVQTQQPLMTGSAIRLAVQEVGPPLRLSIVPESAPTASMPDSPNAALLNRLLGALAQRMSQASAGTTATQSSPQNSVKNSPNTAAESLPEPTPSPSARTPSASIRLAGGTSAPPVPVASLPSNLQRALLPLGGGADNETVAHSPTTPLTPAPSAPAKLAQALGDLVRQNSLPTTHPTTAATGSVHAALQRAATELRSAAVPMNEASSPATPTATTPPSVAVAQWLNQLETSQLRSAIQQLSGQPSWLLDLPVQLNNHAQRLQLTVQREASATHRDAEKAPWQLEFALDLPNLGAIHGSLRLQENRLSVRLYAEDTEAQTALRTELPQLDHNLRAAQLTPDALNVYAGPPPAAVRDRLTPPLPFDPTRLAVKV